MTETKTDLVLINEEVSLQLADKEVQANLLATVFKKMTLPVMKAAITEGMIRGFKFKDFLEKNVYAIGYGAGYSLVTSIDYSRKIAMRSGLAGKSEPKYVEDGSKIKTCSITVKKPLANGTVGDFTATVYFDEYYKEPREYNGKKILSLWDTKPHTMIAKVAEMHALRMAFPEELAQQYVEEEMQKEIVKAGPIADKPLDIKATIVSQLKELGAVVSPREKIVEEIKRLTQLDGNDETKLQEISDRLSVLISEKQK